MNVRLILLLGAMALVVGCPELGDDGGSGVDGSAEGDVDAGGAGGAGGTGGGVDAGVDAGVESGNWYDPATGLCWQDPPPDSSMDWGNAVLYCGDLELGGFDDWRLPKIQELISFIRGCDQSACGVTDPSCLDMSCTNCASCSVLSGPGKGGCYWDPGVRGSCGWFWSSSSYAGYQDLAWVVAFGNGYVDFGDKDYGHCVRCVRFGP